jgi:hypothetical protein
MSTILIGLFVWIHSSSGALVTGDLADESVRRVAFGSMPYARA